MYKRKTATWPPHTPMMKSASGPKIFAPCCPTVLAASAAMPKGAKDKINQHEFAKQVGEKVEAALHGRALFFREQQRRDAEKDRKDDDLRHLSRAERLKHILRHEVEQHVRQTRNLSEISVHFTRQTHTDAGTKQLHDENAERHRHDAREGIEEHDLAADTSEDAKVSHRRQTGEQVKEDERQRCHQQEANEEIADRLHDSGAFAENYPCHDPCCHEDENLQAEREATVTPKERRLELGRDGWFSQRKRTCRRF